MKKTFFVDLALEFPPHVLMVFESGHGPRRPMKVAESLDLDKGMSSFCDLRTPQSAPQSPQTPTPHCDILRSYLPIPPPPTFRPSYSECLRPEHPSRTSDLGPRTSDLGPRTSGLSISYPYRPSYSECLRPDLHPSVPSPQGSRSGLLVGAAVGGPVG